MSDSQRDAFTLLRATFAEEAGSRFARLRRIPQTDIIWFLDYFSGLSGADGDALLDALADWGAMALSPQRKGPPQVAAPLAQMREVRGRPGSKGGTRYTAIKMLVADPSFRDPGGYHESWREHFTALHFQPRPDLLPDLSHLKAAKAPLLRKLVNTALTQSLELAKEKLPGGVGKYIGRSHDCKLTVRVDFGSMLGQLCYTLTLKSAEGQTLIPPISYENLWDVAGGWDYLTEENAARAVEFFAQQVAYFAKLGEQFHGRTGDPTRP